MLDASSTETVDPARLPAGGRGGRRYRHLPLRNTNKKFNPVTARTLHFPVWGDPESGRVSATPFDGAQEIEPVFGDGRPAVWRWSAPLIERRPDDLVCRVIKGRDGARVDVFQKDWLHRDAAVAGARSCAPSGCPRRSAPPTRPSPSSSRSSGHVFESPKPTGLVRRILQTMPADAVVMDFFAGSGTTGHAVALQNVADGGTRRCISVNSAEPTRPGSNADLAGYATVADITRARLQAVAETRRGWFRGSGLDGLRTSTTERGSHERRTGGAGDRRIQRDRRGDGQPAAAEGFEVYAVARRVDRMAGACGRGRAHLRDGRHRRRVDGGRGQRIVDEQGRIDVLVNNAGYGSYGAVEDVPIDEARRQFEVNVFGLARLTQPCTPTMRQRGEGRIINISSIGGKFYEPLGAWYHATKFAVEGFSDSLRLELKPFGIDVVIIEPGPIITEWNTISRDSLVETSRGGAYEERAERVGATIGARRLRLGRQLARRGGPQDRQGGDDGAPEGALPRRSRRRHDRRARKVLPDSAMDAVIGRMYR